MLVICLNARLYQKVYEIYRGVVMENIIISIIVPVYNVEQYLKKCLDSLVNQTMKEIEIIVVNDASPDNSKDIMERYQKEYPETIKCVDREISAGPGAARNTGIRCAKGEYLLFIDGDDYADITMCEKLYQVAQETDSDIVSCEYKEGQEGNFREVDQFSTQVMGVLNYEKRRLLMSVHSVGPVAKIIRKSIIVDNELFFPEFMRYEDLATIPLWWVYANRYEEVKEPMYYYIRHENSVTKTKNSAGYYEVFKAAVHIYNRFIERGLRQEYQECMNNILLRAFIDEIKFLIENVDEPDIIELQLLREEVLKRIPDYKKNPMLYMRNDPKPIAGAKILMESAEKFCELLKNHDSSQFTGTYHPYYEYRARRIDEFLKYCEQQQYSVAIWGAGIKGTAFLDVCDADAQRIHYVIDKNEKNWGKTLSTGHVICGFKDVYENVDIVLVMNKVYFGGVYREVKKINSEIKLVNLDLLLMSDIIEDIKVFVE